MTQIISRGYNYDQYQLHHVLKFNYHIQESFKGEKTFYHT